MYLNSLVSYSEDYLSWHHQVTYAVGTILADIGTEDVDYQDIIIRLKDNDIISKNPSPEELEDTEEIIDTEIEMIEDM